MEQKNKLEKNRIKTEWTLSDLLSDKAESTEIKGNPGIVNFKNAKAVSFNGSSDAVIVDIMPLSGCKTITAEVIFRPVSSGGFEQRFLHCGEVQGDRLLLELRSTPEGWYFDAFIKTGDDQLALIDPGLLHPYDQWYHVAYVINNNILSSWVNGIKELEGKLEHAPLSGGKTSIGARQNEVSWFRGDIYKIRLTDDALASDEFMIL
jgi:hypothetical protein